ncbi:MAG: septum formation initiator family protein [Verrucomicrobiota bacterium]
MIHSKRAAFLAKAARFFALAWRGQSYYFASATFAVSPYNPTAVNGTSYDQLERRHTESSGFRLLNRFLILVIIVALCIGAVIASIPVYKQYQDQNEKIVRCEKDLLREKALYARRSREEQLLKNDPAYLEIVSRDRLDVMKPGETIIRLEPPRTIGSPSAPLKN